MRVSTLVAGPWLLLLQAPASVAPDGAGSALAHVAGVADIVVTLALLVLVVVATIAARSLLKTSEKVSGLIDRIEGDVTTVTRAGAEIAEHGRSIATLARKDAEHLHETITMASEGARRGITHVEERMRGLGATAGLLQDEVEGVLTSATSAIRGIRDGAAAIPRGMISRLLRGRGRKRGNRRTERMDAALRQREDGSDGRPRSPRAVGPREPRIRRVERPRSNREAP